EKLARLEFRVFQHNRPKAELQLDRSGDNRNASRYSPCLSRSAAPYNHWPFGNSQTIMSDTDTFSHDDLMDQAKMGAAPSEDYLKRVEALDNVIRECIHVSHGFGGIPSPTARHF